MKYLVTGGCGFLGANLSAEVLRRGEELFVLDNLYREGSSANLQWLRGLGKFSFCHADIRSCNDVEKAVREIKPDVIFHLAGQVAMTTSIDDPRKDFEVNVLGGHNVLEAVRKFAPECILTYSSTNKVYGSLEHIDYRETPTRYVAPDYPSGFGESLPLDFQSPYGCSKGAVDQYMLDYHRMFGLRTVVFRHSSIFGGRQFSTYDQGWIGWFVKQALAIKKGELREEFTISGDGKQVRDVLFVGDMVRCYFSAAAHIEKTAGQPFNIGGGVENSLSLLELFAFLEKKLDISMKFRRLPWRTSDQKVFCADTSKARRFFSWEVQTDRFAGVEKMIAWFEEN
ncbi:MAG: GDP-mannose 4,6-dehydratase [Nitrospinae bacterium]|nr:GDP-mannose 4,6-dehydratase [Nitrospinota bacterium]